MSELESKGITSWIQVDDERLECYSPGNWESTTGDTTVVDCWIASQVGKTFAVVLSTPRETLTNDYVAFLKIDGHRLSDRIISRADKTDITWWNGAREGDLRRPFIFASTNVTDDDTLLDSLQNAQNSRIGEIKIQIYRVTGLHDVVVPNVKQYTLPPVQTVHETSVKAARPLHQISLGEGAPEIYGSNIRYAYHERHECLVTFVFRYRPIGRVTMTWGSTSSPLHSVPQPRSTQSKPSSQADIRHIKRESESNTNGQDIQHNAQTISHLENEERHLMEQLESLRKRKRDTLHDEQTELPAKIVKKE
ncbi:hypothetical protein D9619_003966 [Psilocybe cf. subviscida]|uniref:DUF7918 domain-containing protein n=1 Tax=Psilocybe cf. subviscida TaxID=2480587 RepID=A0A8H5BP05_9AGAR|nr:hypothetical protein D9619_003966 [Psilocybe cf. subviscida]